MGCRRTGDRPLSEPMMAVRWHIYASLGLSELTHWGQVTHICVKKLTIIGLDNGLSPGRRQAIIWTNAGILLIGALGTNVSEILIKICTFSLKKMLLKMSGKRRPSCLGLNELSHAGHTPQSGIPSWWTSNIKLPLLDYCFPVISFQISVPTVYSNLVNTLNCGRND